MSEDKYSEHLPEKFGFKEGAEKFPLMILPQVSNLCNSGCVHCWFNANKSLRKRDGIKHMPSGLLKKIIDEVAAQSGIRPLVRITGTGEPFMMPELTEVLVYGTGEKGVRIGIITNGSLLTPERSKALIDAGVEAIEVSADAADKET